MPSPGSSTVAVVLACIAVAILVALSMAVWRRLNRSPARRLAAVTDDRLQSAVIADGEGGEILLEWVLLTADGVLVVDMRHADGHVFGSDAMREWVVITGERRYSFHNPQDGLYDRVAAVKRLLPDTPVDGLVVFTGSAAFPKGVPSHVDTFDDLLTRLRRCHPGRDLSPSLRSAWQTLVAEARAVTSR